MKCSEHPKYKGARRPRAQCKDCSIIFLRAENERLKKELEISRSKEKKKCNWCGSWEHDTNVCPAHYEPDYY